MAADPVTAVSVRLRDTSYYVGQPFQFYVQVEGVRTAPPPQLEPSPAFEIRYVNSAPATQAGVVRVVSTYEATPLKSGDLQLPAGSVDVGDRRLTIPATPVSVREPDATKDMSLEVSMSHEQCYLGEPITVTVTWTSVLSFNGIKAVNLKLPFFGSPYFKVYPPEPDIDPKAQGAIGIPVSGERVIAQFSDATLDGRPAVKISFQRILVPVQSTSVSLLLPGASLLSSYAEPRDQRFKGARYPSYFNNEFFDEDVSGIYQRLLLRSAPLTLRILPLPEAGRPENFSGIVGAFRAEVTASTSTVGAGQPLTLRL
ncbi:MAG: hypothetical protein ABL994_22405, partial [Verrucomicrobiales bacterium]